MLDHLHRAGGPASACAVRSGKSAVVVNSVPGQDGSTFGRSGNLLKDSPKISKDAACKIFDNWAEMVDQAVRAARKARTLESGAPPRGFRNLAPLKYLPMRYNHRTVQWESPLQFLLVQM